ncbi:hypothetical protein AMTRI_Chr04g253020 [Amborella trichopoda]
MAERTTLSSSSETRKSLFGVICVSFILLIISSSFLLRSNNSLLSESVLMLMAINSTLESTTKTKLLEPSDSSTLGLQITNPKSNIGIEFRDISRSSDTGKKSKCDPNQAFLKVYMYDLPPDFHFGLLGWKPNGKKIWPDIGTAIPEYPGGLNWQHSMEYWLALDLLASNTNGALSPCTAVRVNNSSFADVFFVPFFSSISYNRHSKLHGNKKISKNSLLQDKLVKFLMGREEWNKWGGKDHLIVAHHPNSMLMARDKLGSAMFVLADFGRYSNDTANLQKDIIAPYMHVVRSIKDDTLSFKSRRTLAYFQGAVYRKDGGIIRQDLYYLLKDEKDVHFAFGSAKENGITKAGQGMASSKFCLNIAGDTPSSNRLFDAIASHCVPVIISDDIELPYEDVLDYSKFCIFIKAPDAIKPGFILNLLRGIGPQEWTQMAQRVKEVAHHFEYQFPSQPGDAVQMIWGAVGRKLSSRRLKLHRENRYKRSQLKQQRF